MGAEHWRCRGPISEKPPCKDCGERYPACHDSCARYSAWKAKIEKARAAKREDDRKYGRYTVIY